MLKYVASLIWSDNKATEDLDDAFKVLEEAEKSTKPIEKTEREPQSENKNISEQKIGFITSVNHFTYTIDNTFSFISEHKAFNVGNKVSYTLYCDANNWKVSNVEEIIDDWSCSDITNAQTKKWCFRNIIGVIEERSGRVLKISDLKRGVDLNQVECEFVPIVGDWVELETKSELDESVANLNGQVLEVIKINPLRTKIIEGVIKSFRDTFTGTINKDIFFNKDALLDGYIPKVNDRVVAEVIESNQNKCYWRALKIVLYSSIDRQNKANIFDLDDQQKLNKYQHNFDGLQISDNITVNAKNFNEINTSHISIFNESSNSISLNNITFDSNTNQVQLIAPIISQSKNFIINSNERCEFIFNITAKTLGTSRETILFHFGKICVARFVFIDLEISNIPKVQPAPKGFKSKADLYESMKKSTKNPIRYTISGDQSKIAPRFVMRRLKDYKVPQKLESLVLNYDNVKEYETNISADLVKFKLCLREDLNYQNYEDRLHTLLYLEEIFYKLSMMKYQRDRGCFIKDKDFLILEIENLAESRPSIIVGDSIIATSLNTPDSFRGFVHKVTGSHVFIKFASMFHQGYNGDDFSIDVIASRSSFIKLHNAIGLAHFTGKELLFPTQINRKKPQVKFTYDPYEDTMPNVNLPNLPDTNQIPVTKSPDKIVPKTKLLDKNPSEHSENNADQIENGENGEKTLTPNQGNKKKSRKELLQLLKAKKQNGESVFKLEWFNTNLNYYQKEAVRNIIVGEARPLPYIIFGPPGTGKTVTIIECILQILRLLPHSRILVGTPSNSAADLLTTRLIDNQNLRPGDLIRLVAYRTVLENKVPPKIAPFSGTVSIAKEGTTDHENVRQDSGITLDLTLSAISRHRIIIGTCSALGSLLQLTLSPGHFTHVIVDEAGQCTEPEIMIPVGLVDVNDGQIILAGDPMQLGPVILSPLARSFGLDETYMERLLGRFLYLRDVSGFPNTGGYDPRLVTKLLYNYRALPDLLHIPNLLFYHSELRSTISEIDSAEAKFLDTLKSVLPLNKKGRVSSLVFHGVIGSDERSDDCPSWFNPDEASQIFYYLNEFYSLGVKTSDVCIITPYIRQVHQIREILREADFDLPKIGTVEELQGQEYKIVLLSTVRSRGAYLSTDQKFVLGFVSNPKRFNVALTRSQCLTIIVGNPILLQRDNCWNELIQYCQNNNSYVGCTM